MSAPRGRAPAPAVPWLDVLASLPDAVLVVDRQGVVAAVNPAAEDLLETSADQIGGRPLAATFAAPATTWLQELARETLRDGRLRHRADATWETRARRRTVEATVAPIHDAGGALWGAVLVMHDTSGAAPLTTDAQEIDRLASLRATVLGLAHEVRNPLAGIKGAGELLGGVLDAPARARCVTVITREVDRLARLVGDLARLGEPPALRRTAVNVHRILLDVLALEAETPAWGAIRLRTDFDPSLPPVHGDPDRLTQLFLNLIRNAVEALGGSGLLLVSSHLETGLHVRRAGGWARLVSIRVEDDGPGVPPEIASSLFSPFCSTKARGSGLGLAIAHQIAAAHGGGLTYEPRPGGGSIFLVRLPLDDSNHAAT